MEVTCQACGGDGQQIVPVPELDERGNPMIAHVYRACSACGGNGKVMV